MIWLLLVLSVVPVQEWTCGGDVKCTASYERKARCDYRDVKVSAPSPEDAVTYLVSQCQSHWGPEYTCQAGTLTCQ